MQRRQILVRDDPAPNNSVPAWILKPGTMNSKRSPLPWLREAPGVAKEVGVFRTAAATHQAAGRRSRKGKWVWVSRGALALVVLVVGGSYWSSHRTDMPVDKEALSMFCRPSATAARDRSSPGPRCAA